MPSIFIIYNIVPSIFIIYNIVPSIFIIYNIAPSKFIIYIFVPSLFIIYNIAPLKFIIYNIVPSIFIIYNIAPSKFIIYIIVPSLFIIYNIAPLKFIIYNSAPPRPSAFIIYNIVPSIFIIYNIAPSIFIIYNSAPSIFIIYNSAPSIFIIYNIAPSIFIIYNIAPSIFIIYNIAPSIFIIYNIAPSIFIIYNIAPSICINTRKTDWWLQLRAGCRHTFRGVIWSIYNAIQIIFTQHCMSLEWRFLIENNSGLSRIRSGHEGWVRSVESGPIDPRFDWQVDYGLDFVYINRGLGQTFFSEKITFAFRIWWARLSARKVSHAYMLILNNFLLKYADDIDLVIPPTNADTIETELQGISDWAAKNNLALNYAKSHHIVIRRPRFPRDHESIAKVKECHDIADACLKTVLCFDFMTCTLKHMQI